MQSLSEIIVKPHNNEQFPEALGFRNGKLCLSRDGKIRPISVRRSVAWMENLQRLEQRLHDEGESLQYSFDPIPLADWLGMVKRALKPKPLPGSRMSDDEAIKEILHIADSYRYALRKARTAKKASKPGKGSR